jgi:glycosyltransferase involved in cell wall biosynthesis
VTDRNSVPTLVFDIRANHDTGVSRYGQALLTATAPLIAAAGWRLIVVARSAQQAGARVATARFAARIVCGPDEGFVRRARWLRELLVAEHADLYFTSHYTLDRLCPVPFVLTIHDLTRLRLPALGYTDASFAEQFGSSELRLLEAELDALAAWVMPHDGVQTFHRYFWALNRFLAHRARHIVTVSRTSARDLRLLLGVDQDRITVVPCGVDQAVFFRRSQPTVEQVRARHGLTGPYLMFVGLTHPNKRFPWLVDQLIRHRHQFPAGTRLAAVGGHAEQVPELRTLLARREARGFVAFPGRVSDVDLAALYTGASALVTASISEGSGLPSLEALACGCPVIATDIRAFRETLRDSARFYDPASAAQLATLAQHALASHVGRPPVADFQPPRWADSARLLFAVLNDAIDADTGGREHRHVRAGLQS